MASPFGGINMMSYALRNFQAALQTSGHNVANVNTQGYSRQRVSFSVNEPLTMFTQGNLTSIGQGMHVSQISRIRDVFLDRNLATSNSNLNKFSTAAAGLHGIEEIYGEPGDLGITSAIGKFFDAWSGLGSNPSDQGARLQLRNAGQVLADRVRGAWQNMDRSLQDVDGQIQSTFTQIDDLAANIDRLNKAIRAASGQNANDLMDQRDTALRELSSLVNVNTETFADGTTAVYAAGFTVVDSAGTMPFPKTYDAATGTVSNGLVTSPVRGGKLAGLLIHSSELSNHMSRLDNLADTFRTQINTIHMTGQNSAGTTNVKFFNDVAVPPQTGAIDFDLDPQIVADIDNVMTGVSGNPGDGGLALSLAAVRDNPFASLGNKSFTTYLSEGVDTLASTIAYYGQAEDTETAVNQQIQNQVQAVSGVAIDDEMADLVKYQRSYQAAARTLNVMDQVLQDLIGMLNR